MKGKIAVAISMEALTANDLDSWSAINKLVHTLVGAERLASYTHG